MSINTLFAASRRLRQASKEISNKSILAEVRERDTFIKQKKKSQKERKKEEQAQVHPIYELPKIPEKEAVESSQTQP